MAFKQSQINLLPARWKLSTKLTDVQVKLQAISLVIMCIYIAIVLLLLGWLGFLKVRHSQINTSIDNVSSQLSKFRHVEAAQELLKGKAAFGMDNYKNKINSGLAFNKGVRLFSGLLDFSDISGDPTGKFSFSGSTSDSMDSINATKLVEDPDGSGRKLFAKALSVLSRNSQGKITLNFDFVYLPLVPIININE
ncbi:MAG: hypothetical protein UW69_C0002G0019 [Microgenomates group bacterium GW2011_GWA2_44_7]|uniref:Uncharacterized protein n=1 Tax=Candidatus Woesebacteria bacterium GW2011_GWA1_43_12 TaxID=1618557 RepID=A0A0G1F5C1_9BACT|nr:MAG: hypothetical protein UV66_C0004G0018 [Candidatus Woesebacteria bacterium GW2011_GWA1_43_12]KKT76261.1 MAG: hypothetical protein UW69_C0002G0019 [Microgenomates group bacterium GW2011_GWA2_44_7]KKT77735.1 MAG: hypothetical protein UW73_C0013G0018 [Microgenomates group bacterium GW2011_GWB1_44_8]